MKVMKFYKKWRGLVLKISIIILSGYIILHSERFQEKISPVKYWTKKVNELEKCLKADKWKVKTLEISLQKENSTYFYEKKEVEVKAQVLGENLEEVLTLSKEEHKKTIEEIEDEIKSLRNMQYKDEKLLNDALAHLAKVNKSKNN